MRLSPNARITAFSANRGRRGVLSVQALSSPVQASSQAVTSCLSRILLCPGINRGMISLKYNDKG